MPVLAGFYRLRDVVEEIFGFRCVLPTHPGAAERILFQRDVQKPGDVVPNNTHFDTTRANIEYLRCTGSRPADSARPPIPSEVYPFKGSVDISRAPLIPS